MNGLAFFISATLRRLLAPKPMPEKPYMVFVLGATFCASQRCVSEDAARHWMRRCVWRHLNDGWTVVEATPISTRLRWEIPHTDPMEIMVGYDHIGVGTVTPLRTVN